MPPTIAVVSQVADQPFVPSVSVDRGAPLTENATCVTPMSSVAFAVTTTCPETAPPSTGDVMWICG